jgi:hypothetical protein
MVALASCVAVAEDHMDVKTAFLDAIEDTSTPRRAVEPMPAAEPLRMPAAIEHDSYPPDETVSEPIPPPDSSSETTADHEPHYAEYHYQEGWYSRSPLLNSLHRRWITRTKPALQASYWGYPEYFEERPFGSFVVRAERMQIVNGLQDQQVLYHYDFFQDDRAATLSPRGEYQLRKIIQRMEIAPCPIIIQTSVVNHDLDEARRQHVLDALQAAGVPAEPEMVVVDHPPLPGLQGLEGTLVYGNLLGQTQARGGGFQYGVGGGRPTAIFIGGGIGVTQPAR